MWGQYGSSKEVDPLAGIQLDLFAGRDVLQIPIVLVDDGKGITTSNTCPARRDRHGNVHVFERHLTSVAIDHHVNGDFPSLEDRSSIRRLGSSSIQ